MAYPPSAMTNTMVDATPAAGSHAPVHVAVANAINDIVTELGTNPSGASADVTTLITLLAYITETVTAISNSGAAVTIPNVLTATMHRYTLTANCTFTFPTAAAGKSFLLELRQDATGSRTATWPGTVKWPAATAPTLTTTVSKSDFFSFVCLDGTNWQGSTAGLNYA